jgi:hypothetical protein
MPFIQALGYDMFDPLEVVPELVADVGVKKGEKTDFRGTVDRGRGVWHAGGGQEARPAG